MTREEIIAKLEKYGLTEQEYESIIESCVAKVDRTYSDLEWQDIVEDHNLNIHYDTLRKNCTGIFGSVFVKEYYENKMMTNGINDDEYLSKLEEKRRSLERLRVQYRDERNAWSKQNYSAARIDSTLSLLEDELKALGKINFKIHPIPSVDGENAMIICLADLHIGQTFDSIFGKYDTDVAKRRLSQYLNKIISVAKIHNVKNAYVVGLGDQISGSIHRTIAISNKENVIEQIKIATEIISSFCYELTKVFNNVYYADVVGNHSRLTKKEDAVHDERLDDTIGWAVSLSLNHIENFHYFKHRNLDSGILDLNICGKTYLAVHGDMDSNSKQGVANLSFMVGCFPYCILSGHRHFPAVNEFNGVKMVQSGSLAGSGDSYTIEKRLTGKASQTTLICNKDGIECIYNVELD